MPLSPRDLETPHRPARQDYGQYEPSMTRVEASFYHGCVDEMQQWLDSGVLAKLMQAKSRATTPYHDAIPTRLLQAARQSVITGGAGLSLEDGLRWWDTLMSLRTKDKPRPVTDWLTAGACLPWPLFDQWIREGSSPHATPISRQTRSSPFLALLSDTLLLQSNLRQHRHAGWPPRSQLFDSARTRLQAWADAPGMKPHEADEALLRLADRALVYDPTRSDDWLVKLRDSVLAQGGSFTDRAFKEVLVPVLAPSAPAVPARARTGVFGEFEQARLRREEYRVSGVHQQRVAKWAAAMATSVAREGQSSWRTSLDAVSLLLRSGTNLQAVRSLLDDNPEIFQEGDGYAPYRSTFFFPKDQPDTESAHLHRLQGLLSLKSHSGAPSRPWIATAASDVAARRTLTAAEMSAWLDMFEDVEDSANLVHSWMGNCVRSDTSTEQITQVLAVLHQRGALSCLDIQEGVQEGSEEDLRTVRKSLANWLLEDRLAGLLRALPGPPSSRIAKLHLFFVDPALPTAGKAKLFAEALDKNPGLLMPALIGHLSKFERASTDLRIPGYLDMFDAFSSLDVQVEPDQAVGLWRAFGEHLSPRDATVQEQGVSRKLAASLASLAPLSMAQGQPLVEMQRQEALSASSGTLPPALARAWASLDPLVVELVSLGLDLQQVPTTPSDTPLSEILVSHRLHQELATSSPHSPSRPSRRF